MSRPVVIIGGWLSSPTDYLGMANVLASFPYGRVVYVTDINRWTWASLRDPDFRVVMDIIARTVELALTETGAPKVDLIGHSAGGRLARAYLGDVPCQGVVYDGKRYVDHLTTLGTAHATTEIFVAQFGAFVQEAYPGAYYPQVAYCSVVGETVHGRRWGRPEEIVAFRSYELVCGNGSEIGDGVIPSRSAYLTGADNLILRGVRHAPYNASRSWYGAADIVAEWFDNSGAENQKQGISVDQELQLQS
ncbi:MAG: lipase [Chloroflexales bacterium]|nr:lipase [Chloroflexales bacterium]